MTLYRLMLLLILSFGLVGCSFNQIAKIEAENHYEWQKYMNKDEFEQLENGMSYMDVVKVAKGEGIQVNEKKYIWPDEIVLTHVYEVKFEDDKLVEKKIVERIGNSTRDLDE